MDLLTSLPLHYFSNFFFFIPPSFLKLIRLLRFFRLLRQFHFLQSIDVFNRNLVWFSQLFFSFFLLTHTIGCFWLGLGYHYGLESTDWVPTKDFAEISFISQYLRAFFWAFTAMTSNGLSPKTPVEVIFSLFVVFFGLTFYATLIGSVGSFIISSDLSTQLFREKMEKIDDFAQYRNLPEKLHKRIKNYYEYLYSKHCAINEQEILEDLPISLKQDVCLYMNQEIVEKVEFFKNCNNNLISSIVTHLKPIVSVPGEYIIRAGDIGKEMFFISSGACEVLIETDKGKKTVAILKEGSFFGESSLLFHERRNASIRALTYVDLYVLTKEVLDEIQNEFPDFKEIMEKTALNRKKDTQNMLSVKTSKTIPTKTNVEKERDEILQNLIDQNPDSPHNLVSSIATTVNSLAKSIIRINDFQTETNKQDIKKEDSKEVNLEDKKEEISNQKVNFKEIQETPLNKLSPKNKSPRTQIKEAISLSNLKRTKSLIDPELLKNFISKEEPNDKKTNKIEKKEN